MKYLLVKLLAIIMLGTMLLGAASAQTKGKHWVYFSKATDPYGNTDIAKICGIDAGRFTSWDGKHWFSSGGSLFCGLKPAFAQLTFTIASLSCPDGSKFIADRPQECYKLKEATENCYVIGTSEGYPVCGDEPESECPEGQVKDGEQCLDECELAEKNGAPLPEGCLQCPDEAPKSVYGKVQGAVACNDTQSKVCTYVDNPYYFGGSFWSKTAKGIATKCIEAHEREHKNDPQLKCHQEGWLAYPNKDAQREGEIAAYKKGEECLREAKEECGWNSICHLEVWGEIVNSENNIGRYEQK